jgi:hypothetical protein
MIKSPIDSLTPRRRIAPAAVVVACLATAGCGGSGHGATTSHGFPGGIRPIGPANLTANLTGLMKSNQPQLKNVKARCPSATVTKFPVHCTFTATQVAPTPSSKKQNESFPGPYRVAGTITVLGVYFRTKTYEYGLNYAPTH